MQVCSEQVRSYAGVQVLRYAGAQVCRCTGGQAEQPTLLHVLLLPQLQRASGSLASRPFQDFCLMLGHLPCLFTGLAILGVGSRKADK